MIPNLSVQWTEIREAHLIDASTGWVLQGDKLLWSGTAGSTFKDITPPLAAGETINTAYFYDSLHGWVVIQEPPAQPDVNTSVTIAATSDSGASWILAPVGADNDFLLTAYSGTANLSFVSPQIGFGLFRINTSSAGSAAGLFGTTDRGRTWKEVSHPGYGELKFLTPLIGWSISHGGRSDQSHLFHTVDGGLTWTESTIALPPGVTNDWEISFRKPSFSSLQTGTVEGFYRSSSGTDVTMIAHYRTEDGYSWKFEGSEQYLGSPSLKITTLDHSTPPQISLHGPYLSIRSAGGVYQRYLSLDIPKPLSFQPGSADFSDSTHGWIVIQGGFQLGNRFARSALLSTSDGGATVKVLLKDIPR